MSLIVLQKVRKQGIRFWDERTFWHEMIYKSLVPTFGSLQFIAKGLPKVGIKLYKSSHARMFSGPKILFLISLLFVACTIKLNPYLATF